MRLLTRSIPILLAAGLLSAAATGAVAGELPARLGYSFYIDGKPVGRTDIRVTRSPDALVFESRTHITLAGGQIDLSCRTEADPRTFVTRRFSMKGTRGGLPVASEVTLRGDSAIGWIQRDDQRLPRKLEQPGGFIVFEDWVMELEVLLALRQGTSSRVSDTYHVLFGNSLTPTVVIAGYTGDVIVESAARSMAARKLEIVMQGAVPFESRVDPDTGVPVYLRFTEARAEAFLDDFFGDTPDPYFTPRSSGATGP